jgi:hypothetical protein
MDLREWMLNPDDAPGWFLLVVFGSIAALAVIAARLVAAPWWTVPIPLGVVAGIWQLVAERLRARERPRPD